MIRDGVIVDTSVLIAFFKGKEKIQIKLTRYSKIIDSL